jgi:sulfatase-like protein
MKLPSYPWRFAHLAALWGYGVSQPVFSLLKGNPEFLVINGASRAEAVTFAVVLAFGPPLVGLGLEALLGLVSAKASALAHVLLVWMFGFTALLQVLDMFDPTSRASILIPAVVAYLGAMAYTRWRPLQSFLSISLVLPVLALVLFIATAPLAVADAAPAKVEVRGETPVVLVVFDEFALSSLMRADGSVDATRYPAFGRLAREGTWYARATSVYELTTAAVPAILTGDVPTGNELPTLADYPDNLFTLLGDSYAFRVREPVTRLCPASLCPDHDSDRSFTGRVRGLLHDVGIDYLYGALPRDFRTDLSPLREGWGNLVDETGSDGQGFVDSIRRSNPSRSLYVLHVLEPHVPWDKLPSGVRYNDGSAIPGITDDWQPGKYERWRDDVPWLVDEALQRHLLQVGNADRFLGTILRRLDQTGLYDRALVIVTADHGVSFRSGGWRRHATDSNIADIAGVPLFVKYPEQRRGREDRRAAETIDVVPTIADVLGVRLPWKVDGRSLLAPPVRREVRVGGRHGPPVVASPQTVADGVLAAARRNASLFGQGRDSLYRLGPRPELLGRSVAALEPDAAEGAELRIAREDEFGRVVKASRYGPAQILGRVSWSGLRPADDLAVAINGRVAAVTKPYRSHGDTRFATMIDENVLHDGWNSVDVFAVRGRGAQTRLVLLGGNDAGAARSSAAGVDG